MLRPSLLSGLLVVVCLLFTADTSYAQLNNGQTGGGGGNNNTGGLIGGNNTGGVGGNTAGLIGDSSAVQAAQAAQQQGVRATGNFQNGLTENARGVNQTTRQFGGGGGGGGARRGGQVAAPRRVIRPVLRIAFDYPLPSKRVESTLNRKLDRVSIRLNNRFRTMGIKVGDKGLVTLIGQVQSEDDKKLAAAYVRLEPGVRKVKSDIRVVPPKR